MSYHVQEIEIPSGWFAVRRVQETGLSRIEYQSQIDALKHDILLSGAVCSKAEYEYIIVDDLFDEDKQIGLVLYIAIEKAIDSNDIFQCVYSEMSQQLLRVSSNEFEEVHIGLAEYMHEHDLMANGPVRVVMSSNQASFVIDSPFTVSDE